jgi:hypothetical protein
MVAYGVGGDDWVDVVGLDGQPNDLLRMFI